MADNSLPRWVGSRLCRRGAKLALIVATLGLTGFFCDSEMCGNGGCSLPAAPPAAPAAPPIAAGAVNFAHGELNKYPADRFELHGAASFPDCKRMAQRFKDEGRKVRLIRALPLDGDGPLKYMCIFDGEDVDNGVFEDNRYNSSKEFETP